MGLGAELAVWSVIPFAGLLLAIAVLPLALPHFWESNRNRSWVVAGAALPVVVYLIAGFGSRGIHALDEKLHEYLSFIALLGALFVITGGICVRGSFSGTPLLNTSLLGIGALLANVIGTTGASVLLIRPLLAANAPRRRVVHVVVFFIFVVSNCGGLLSPLGDPPLFLGFLKGVPFTWTFSLWRPWLLINGSLLLIFSVWDRIVFAREQRERAGSLLEAVQRNAPLRIDGAHNFVGLFAIVAVNYASGRGLLNGGESWPFGLAELAMVGIAGLSWLSTREAIRRSNHFSFAPIIEVAVLFAGLFLTMAPALLLLNAKAGELGLAGPAHFFWATGLLSSVLDNAPTYLAFTALACGIEGVPLEGRYLAEFLALGPDSARLLAAISTGAVVMGANTYIGNGPNFMVKAIAEARGVRMPGFFGYMLYSGCILIPLCAIATLVFFR